MRRSRMLEDSTTRRSAGLVLALSLTALAESASAQSARERLPSESKARERTEQSQREEGQAVLSLADAAAAGRATASDFAVRWSSHFFKAQQGTFVPFTLTIHSGDLTSALVYIRAAVRGQAARALAADRRQGRNGRWDEKPAEIEYPVDAIFPVDLTPSTAGIARISRGFSVAPGAYDVIVVVRERVRPGAQRAQPRASVLEQQLDVPDFWSGDLTTSSILVADRLTVLNAPVSPDELVERPYVIGQNEITPAADLRFHKTEELIVVFLVYNPMVAPDRKFDLQVEYHFFRRVGPGTKAVGKPSAVPRPPERDGELYFNHTDPQRFNPVVMGAQFDPSAGHPVMAGQGIPLAGFEPGDYRLAIRVTDLLSGKSITRDVNFTVGS